MTDLAPLLDVEPVVATAGIDLLAEALDAQGVRVERTEWQPPPATAVDALATLAAGDTAAANDVALERMVAVRPHLVDVVTARDVHAGVELETTIDATEIVRMAACQSSSTPGRMPWKIRRNAAIAAAFVPVDMNAVTPVGAPS